MIGKIGVAEKLKKEFKRPHRKVEVSIGSREPMNADQQAAFAKVAEALLAALVRHLDQPKGEYHGTIEQQVERQTRDHRRTSK